jgi:hypothetical protein
MEVVMKKITVFAVLFVLFAAVVFSGCGDSGGSGDSGGAGGEPVDTLGGAGPDILESVLADADEALGGGQLPQTFGDPVTAETAQGLIGLTPEQFDEYVTEAQALTAALMTSAYEVALIKCKDFEAAATVKDLVAGGFDSAKWICVMPEESFVIDSGSYVLLAAVGTTAGDAIIESFTAAAEGNVGEVNVFFEGQ